MLDKIITKKDIQIWLKTIQFKAKFGERLISISEIARASGIHRDTLYEAIGGSMSQSTQVRLSLVIRRLDEELEGKSLTKLAHVKLFNNEMRLGFGLNQIPILKKDCRK
jgi:DNA-binding phage protein